MQKRMHSQLGVFTGPLTPSGPLATWRPIFPKHRLCLFPTSRPCRWGYLSVTGSAGRESFIQVTSGGGDPWASQSRVTSSPALAVMLRGLSVSWEPFTWILGLAVGGSS